MRKLNVPLMVIAVFAMVLPLLAHHAFTAEFDAKKPIKLRGTVAKIELINPHSWIHIDVKNADGSITRWMIEGGTPNTLLRRGSCSQQDDSGTYLCPAGMMGLCNQYVKNKEILSCKQK